MRQFILVCLGGAAGSGARYLLALSLKDPRFPWATLTVNVVGSFLMGFLMSRGLPPSLRAPVTTGILGGFTTYSAFNYEVTKAMEEGLWRKAALYLAVTVLGCLLAGFAGLALGSDSAPRN